MQVGKVFLVGAGPGDPGLLTLKARDILARAEVIVYDRLANPVHLRWARPEAERVYVGKAPGQVALDQDGINQVLVDRGLAGRLVCRLKGGDPYVFGRGGEEALACLAAGVPFEVVPGITSAIGAPSYAGVPVTHRNVATSFAVITGHENPDKAATQVDYARLANGADTLVFLMGIGNLPEIRDQLLAAGRDPATPAAVVQWGTWPRQRSVQGTLADLVEVVRDSGIQPPAVTVVGEVVALKSQLGWFETRPLHGRTVVVTRSRTQASEISEQLTALGAEVLEFPVIRIVPREVGPAVRAALDAGVPYDWVVFTSTNAVELFWRAWWAAGGDARALAAVRCGAVGQATAAALAGCGLRADFVPRSFSAADFAREFPGAGTARVWFPSAAKAADTVPAELRALGATVDVLPLYDTVLDPSDAAPLAERLASGEIDAVTFTSSSTAENFRQLLPDADLGAVCLASIGPKTSATLRQLGLPPTVEAAEATLDGLVAVLQAHFAGD
ncbi:MAG: uroporphyrinogen-III C-methyltransferase [Fimbriimonadaceae bacterium]|nr:uroporphyrinogen-III C-methyltransferase [Fimbriimonadaceae bacterium]